MLVARMSKLSAVLCSLRLSVLHNYFDSPTKFIFRFVASQIFRYFSKIVLPVCTCILRSNMRTRYAHSARMYTHDDLACYLRMQSRPGWFSSLERTRTHGCDVVCGTRAHSDTRSYTRTLQMQVDGGGRVSIGSSIATDACCYAARATLSRFRLLCSSNFCPLPLLASLPRVVPPLLTEKRFSPFLPRDRALTLSPTRLGGGKHEAQQRRRGSRFFFPFSLSLSLSSFFLCGRQYFRTNEAITIVISG